MTLKPAIWIPTLTLLLAGGAALFLTGAGAGTDASVQEKDAYQVVMRRPLRVPGWRANEMFRTEELMTDAFNQLEKEGLVPLFFEVFETGTNGDFTESRAMIVCRER